MDRRYYSKRHFLRVCPPPDTEEQIRDRLLWYKAIELGVAEREAKYPVLTLEVFQEATDFQNRRINEIYLQLKEGKKETP